MPEPLLVAVMGPTASGKTSLAEALAARLDAQLVNADAFQVYRGMDIGTAKPEQRDRYALLDLRNPDEEFGVGEWVGLAQTLLHDLYSQGRNAVVVGGTGFYVRALFEEYAEMSPPPDPEVRLALQTELERDGLEKLVNRIQEEAPEIAATIDLKNPVRVIRALEKRQSAHVLSVTLPAFRKVKFGVQWPIQELETRIASRTSQMVQNGWTQEIERLRALGYRPEHPGFRAIGYRTMWKHIEGELELDLAVATTIADTRAYAKRQMTWLRKEPSLVSLQAGGNELVDQAMSLIV